VPCESGGVLPEAGAGLVEPAAAASSGEPPTRLPFSPWSPRQRHQQASEDRQTLVLGLIYRGARHRSMWERSEGLFSGFRQTSFCRSRLAYLDLAVAYLVRCSNAALL
jgi:hypothetical protein